MAGVRSATIGNVTLPHNKHCITCRSTLNCPLFQRCALPIAAQPGCIIRRDIHVSTEPSMHGNDSIAKQRSPHVSASSTLRSTACVPAARCQQQHDRACVGKSLIPRIMGGWRLRPDTFEDHVALRRHLIHVHSNQRHLRACRSPQHSANVNAVN